ncbi:concanavalin A-like lectin/glucanase [Microthyrium microscopicum]|uniref:Concanavalin A-like lectin/glucanase n=1 Tax=Microthyrium microscopicum TaxID=703497 RepID=A0A6A6U6G7_9PEZI|nr:concanavalin A-like lectin/glucanase [Microthyrium microscopicum]
MAKLHHISAFNTILYILTLTNLCQSQSCPCGYSVGNSVFTEAMETDFTQVQSLNSIIGDWQVQDWRSNASADANIPYNRVTQYANVIAGNSQGLQMMVRTASDDSIGCSEIRTARNDIKFGSFRINMKTTPINGTCAAFFWYQDDAHEIDVEILSRELTTGLDGTPGPVANLVIHSPESQAAGFDASKTNSFMKDTMDWNPTKDFHEYRVDWLADGVQFYTDNSKVKQMTNNVPENPGRVFINHWSNGSPGWSGGPPKEDATMWVRYTRLYFNSSDPKLVQSAEKRCSAARSKGSKNLVCDIGGGSNNGGGNNGGGNTSGGNSNNGGGTGSNGGNSSSVFVPSSPVLPTNSSGSSSSWADLPDGSDSDKKGAASPQLGGNVGALLALSFLCIVSVHFI